jgi:DNA-binding transcriptional regulator GbsR (MarR family)
MSDTLRESKALLVRRWGEMGGYWGISRTMAEIHALLFVSGEPLCTDDVMEQLHVSRGNASMNLRALVDWGLVRREHKLGDRKEYFRADTDVWHMFETIMRERRRREVEPIIATIDRCREMVFEGNGASEKEPSAGEFVQRLDELRNFLGTMGSLFEAVLRVGPAEVGQFAALVAQTSRPAREPSNGVATSERTSARGRSRKGKAEKARK